MSFFDLISRAAGDGIIGNAASSIDRTLHPKLYYKPRDVIIINRIRHFYVEYFKDRPIPDFLRYAHEPSVEPRAGEKNYTVTEVAEPCGKYKPKKGFDPIHEIDLNSYIISHHPIAQKCMSTISTIFNYLNALNTHTNGKETDSLLDRLLDSYGHKNDAVRVIFLLFADAFDELRKISTSDQDCLDLANRQLKFLTKLIYDKTLTEALQSIQPVTFEGSKNILPFDILRIIEQNLGDITTTVKHFLAQYTIAENLRALREDIIKLINQNYLFFVYMFSNKKLSGPIPPNNPTTIFDKLRLYLHMFIRQETNTQIQHSRLIKDEPSNDTIAFDIDAYLPYFDYCPENKWVGFPELKSIKDETGLYSIFLDNEEIENFFNFGGYIKTLSRLCNALSRLERSTKIFGDINSAIWLNQGINLIESSIKDSIELLDINRNKLFKFSQLHYSKLQAPRAQKNPIVKAWTTNFSRLSSLEGDNLSVKNNISNNLSKIKHNITEYIETPKKALQELDDNAKIFHQAYRQIILTLSLYKSEYKSLQDPFFSTPQIRENSNVPMILPTIEAMSEELSPAIEEIINELKAYNVGHGYVNGRATKTFQFNHDQNNERAEWINICLTMLKGSSSEKDKLVKLEKYINKLLSRKDYHKNVSDENSTFHLYLLPRLRTLVSQRTALLNVNEEAENAYEMTYNEFVPSLIEIHKTAYRTLPKKLTPNPAEPLNMSKILLNDIQQIIKYFTLHPEEQADFMQFWSKLLYLNNTVSIFGKVFNQKSDLTKMTSYHSEAIARLAILQEKLDYHDGMRTALESKSQAQLERVKLVHDLTYKGLMTEEANRNSLTTWVDKCAEEIEHEQTLAKNAQIKSRKTLIGKVSACTIWSKEKEEELKNQWRIYKERIGIETSDEVFFQNIAERIEHLEPSCLQTEIEFSKLLMLVTKNFVETSSVENKLFYKGLIQGLLMLGASPMDWINEQLEKSVLPNQQEVSATAMIAELTEIMLSHLTTRGMYIGESAIILPEQFKALIKATNAFGKELHTSCTSNLKTRKFFDFVLLPFKPGFEKSGIEQERQPERTELYWSAIKLIHTIVSEQLLKDKFSGNEPEESAQLAYARLKLNQSSARCQTSLKSGWFINSGYKELQTLLQAIVNINDYIIKVGAVRILHATANGKDLAEQSNLNQALVIEEKDEVIEEKDAVIEEKDAMITETKKWLNQSIVKFINRNLKNIFSENKNYLISVDTKQIQQDIFESVLDIFPISQEQHKEYLDYIASSISTYISSNMENISFVRRHPAGLFAEPVNGPLPAGCDRVARDGYKI